MKKEKSREAADINDFPVLYFCEILKIP